MYRAWNKWRDEKRSHLFLYDLQKKEYYDLLLNTKFDVPPIDLGSSQDYTFSLDGKEIAFVTNTDKVIATSTNNNIFIIELKDIVKDKPASYKKNFSKSRKRYSTSLFTKWQLYSLYFQSSCRL